MPKKFILRTFSPGKKQHGRPMNTLISLSALGLNSSQSILKTSLAMGASESTYMTMSEQSYPFGAND